MGGERQRVGAAAEEEGGCHFFEGGLESGDLVDVDVSKLLVHRNCLHVFAWRLGGGGEIYEMIVEGLFAPWRGVEYLPAGTSMGTISLAKWPAFHASAARWGGC